MTLPGWLGWVATAIIVLGTVYMFYRQSKSKRDKPRTHRWIPLDGFANLWIPLDISDDDALDIIDDLLNAQSTVWGFCIEEYDDQESWWYMDTIGLGYAEPSEGHPNIQYNTGAHKMKIKIQDDMYHHFAGEVHNVYRSFMHGPSFIDRAKDEDDRLSKIKVDALIDATNWEAE